MRPATKYRDRHRRDEDRKIQPIGSDEEQHGQCHHEIGFVADVKKAFGKAATASARDSGLWQMVKFAGLHLHQRDEDCDETQAIDDEKPSSTDGGDQYAGNRGADQLRAIEGPVLNFV